MRALILAAAIVAMLSGQVMAEDNGGLQLAKVCASIEAQTCMLKPETRVCALRGGSCRYIGIENYVKIRRVDGPNIIVDTLAGPAKAPLSGLVTLGDR